MATFLSAGHQCSTSASGYALRAWENIKNLHHSQGHYRANRPPRKAGAVGYKLKASSPRLVGCDAIASFSQGIAQHFL